MARVALRARRTGFVQRKLVYLVAAALGGAVPVAETPAIGPRGPADWRGLPISFERNDGQHEPAVLFTSRGPHGVLTLRSGELAIAPRRASGTSVPVRLKLAGANLAPEIEPLRPLVTRSHYYVGDAKSHFTNIPHYGELRMKDVYPGIDLDIHGRGGTLEYDFVVAPGADPKDIGLDLRGAQRSWIDEEGNLRLEWADQALMQRAPVAYQEQGAQRRAVDARFELVQGRQGPEARIALGDYDRSAPLTVDPVIAYSTYVGASGSDFVAMKMKVDASGAAYFVQRDAGEGTAPIVVSKLDPATNTLVYQTSFAGSSGSSLPRDLALGASGTAYVVGSTSALDFPATPAKLEPSVDAFVVKLGAGGALESGRLLGGTGYDLATGVALDGAGNVYVAGSTYSADFPVTTGQSFNRGGFSPFITDGFVAKLDPALAPQYVRYLGGSGNDYLYAIDVDALGQAVVVGATDSTNLPPAPAFAPQYPPSGSSLRGFAAKVSADGASLLYCQYVGGQSNFASAVAIDPFSGDALIAGSISNATLSPPSVRPFAGVFDAFVLRLRGDGMPTYATYLGGSGADSPQAIGVDARGNVYVAGYTSSLDFPLVAPLAGNNATSVPPAGVSGTSGYGAFVARLRDGELDFSSLLGGSDSDRGFSLSVGAPGTVWVGGNTASPDFPTVVPYRAARMGPDDGFITKIAGLDDSRDEFAGDFNGDGKADIVWQHADGSVALWLMDGGTQLGGGIIRASGTGWSVALVGDFNGDGRADILWTHPDGSAQVWLMNGTSQIGQGALRGPATGWTPLHAADFNGDGRADILWQHRDGSTELWTMNGLTASSTAVLRGPGTGWVARLVGDFNGDHRADILWRREDGTATVWTMNGATTVDSRRLLDPLSAWTPTHVGDIDGDGRDDILARHANGSTALYLMNGAAVSSTTVLTPAGSGLRVTHVGDLNGDRRADILWRGRRGSLAMWLMDGTAMLMNQTVTGTDAKWVPRRLADFAGNGRGGVVLFDRGTTRLWFLNPDTSATIVSLRPPASPWTPVGFDE